MCFVVIIFVHLFASCIASIAEKNCNIRCLSDTKMQCVFDIKTSGYKMFSSKCAVAAYASCHEVDFVQTPQKYCIKSALSATLKSARRYEESCPVFCPSHYRPVCAASKLRGYLYRAFTNGCYLDMVNCRGDDDFFSYVEVPLEFCQRHLMKNIYKEQVVVTGGQDYVDIE